MNRQEFHAGCIVEVIVDAPESRHPEEHRSLLVGDRFPIKEINADFVRYSTIAGDHAVHVCRLKKVPTVDGGSTAKDDLRIGRFQGDWFIYRQSDHHVLCQGIEPGFAPFKLYRPLVWEYADADKWVKFGCIAELQESLGNLDIRFTKTLVVSQREFAG